MQLIISIFGGLVAALTTAEFRRSLNWQRLLKPSAAILFVIIALLGGALYWDYGRWILFGLVACAIGDIALLDRDRLTSFRIGMLAFAIGHLAYIFAFKYYPGHSESVLLPALIPIIAGTMFYMWLEDQLPPDMNIPVMIYTLIIVVMCIRSLGVSAWVVPLAASMFAFSDMFVARDRFISHKPINALWITPFYFAAQLLFALSAALN